MIVTNVLSSHYPESFNAHLMKAFETVMRAGDCDVETYDLYADSFQPVMRGDDFNQFFDKPIPPEIGAIQARLAQTDLLTFFFPVWWNGMPAIMKGWIDRVFSKGFAYDIVDGHYSGKLKIKKVLLVCTLGNKTDDPSQKELEDAMRTISTKGVFGYCGIPEIEHLFLYDVYASDSQRDACVNRVQDLARVHLPGFLPKA